MLSSKKILHGDPDQHKVLDIDLSKFYDQNGDYKHKLPPREKVSQELKDEIKKNDPNATNIQDISWHAIEFQNFMRVKKNDIVVVWSGSKPLGFKIHGYGTVTSEYQRESKDPNFFHQKSVILVKNNDDPEKYSIFLKRFPYILISRHRIFSPS